MSLYPILFNTHMIKQTALIKQALVKKSRLPDQSSIYSLHLYLQVYTFAFIIYARSDWVLVFLSAMLCVAFRLSLLYNSVVLMCLISFVP